MKYNKFKFETLVLLYYRFIIVHFITLLLLFIPELIIN